MLAIPQTRLDQLSRHLHTLDSPVWQTPINNLVIYQINEQSPQFAGIHRPAMCVILQGEREIILGDKHYIHSSDEFMLCTLDMPLSYCMRGGRSSIGATLYLDLALLRQVMAQLPSITPVAIQQGLQFSSYGTELQQAFGRLLDLLDTPKHIAVLTPLIEQEIYYYLLQNSQGERLWAMMNDNSMANRIARATDWLNRHFSDKITVDELAHLAGMSESAFYKVFKQITTLTPIQYQKVLRLNHAKNLIIQEKLPITQVAHTVGYESPNQFSREYKRMFGVSPRGDVGD